MTKARFECESCGADQETFTCNGRGCGMRICLSCIKRHEPACIERCGDRTKSQPKVQAGEGAIVAIKVKPKRVDLERVAAERRKHIDAMAHELRELTSHAIQLTARLAELAKDLAEGVS